MSTTREKKNRSARRRNALTAGATSYKDFPLSDEARPWDGGAALQRWKNACGISGDNPDWARFHTGFFWFDSAKAETVGAHHLLFVDVIDGTATAVWRGLVTCAGAMADSRGARMGYIPATDKAHIRAHIDQYYGKATEAFASNIQPPWQSASAETLQSTEEELAMTTTTTETSAASASEELQMDKCSNCGATMMADQEECIACGEKMGAAEDLEALGVEIEINVSDPDEADEAEVDGEAPEVEMAAPLPLWEGELAFEGLATSDDRYLIPGKISERDLPLTLMAMLQTAEGHMGAHVCGKLTEVWREPRPDLGSRVIAIMARGEFSDEVAGPTAAALVAEEVLRGISVDIAPSRKALIDKETGAEVSQDDADYDTYMEGGYLIGMEGELMGATLVPFPAFGGASMRIVQPDQATTASATEEEQPQIQAETFGQMRLIPVAITASAAGIAPLAPPKEWFSMPEPAGKMPLTVTKDGQVYGHLATWDQCHQGFARECVLAKPSRSNYSMFHVGQLRTAEGDVVDVGRIIVGDSGHAGVNYSLQEASQFYDRSSMVAAFVHAVDGKYGVWLSGAVRSDCPAERVRDMMANPPSGDWRRHDGWLELIAALSVPVPGFPVKREPRYEYALVAGADSVEVSTLVATGYFETDPPTYTRAEMRRREMLLRQGRDLTA